MAVIPQLVDVFLIHEDLNLVFEFCETDLESILLEQSVVLKPAHVKCHVRMLLEGLSFLHRNFVLHRVSKTFNVGTSTAAVTNY